MKINAPPPPLNFFNWFREFIGHCCCKMQLLENVKLPQSRMTHAFGCLSNAALCDPLAMQRINAADQKNKDVITSFFTKQQMKSSANPYFYKNSVFCLSFWENPRPWGVENSVPSSYFLHILLFANPDDPHLEKFTKAMTKDFLRSFSNYLDTKTLIYFHDS